MLKEVGLGLGSFGGFKVETYKSDGRTLSGTVREFEFGPAGKTVDYRWDYAQTRNLVERAVRLHGWQFTTTLRKGQAER